MRLAPDINDKPATAEVIFAANRDNTISAARDKLKQTLDETLNYKPWISDELVFVCDARQPALTELQTCGTHIRYFCPS